MSHQALINEFLIESLENLSSIAEDLTHLEKDPDNGELINKVYRTVHTMKGSASFLGYKKLQDITHAGENLLEAIRDRKIKVTSIMIDALLEIFDISRDILKNIENSNEEGDVEVEVSQRKLENLLKQSPAIETPVSSAALDSLQELVDEGIVDASKLDELQQPGNSVSAAAMESLQDLVSAGMVDEDCLNEFDEPQDQQTPPTSVQNAAMDSLQELIADGKIDASALDELMQEGEQEAPIVEPTKVDIVIDNQEIELSSEQKTLDLKQLNDVAQKSIADAFVRVNVNVLDKIMNIVGELVLNRNQILQYASTTESREFNRLSQQLNIITSELQSEVMSTRMQPIGNVLNQFERLVRDIARHYDKKIDLKLAGQETELDKSLLETIKDPLVHIIRNACDHGIESPSQRLQVGKSEQGQVLIKAYNESGQVTIEICDDGAGIDPHLIGQKAIEKGLVTSDKLAQMSETQIFNLLFKPGFSTAQEVTSISGRGIGMDVVKTNIEKIGGAVSVHSKKGQGTTFKLRIPLTLAIVPSLMIKSQDETFAIPQLNLVELVRLENENERSQIEKISGREFLKLRGKLTPIFRLDSELILDQVQARTQELNAVSGTESSSSSGVGDDALNIIILNAEENVYGIVVDEIMDTEEIVVKPLNNFLKDINIFGGATIRGDGRVALILDALGFLSEVSKVAIEKHENESLVDESAQIMKQTEYQENLLFKLYDDRTYAIPLGLVSRLEEIKIDKIEKTGRQKIIRYLDAPMPLINLEKILVCDSASALDTHRQIGLETLSCVVVRVSGRHYGVVVKEVMDISIDNVDIDDGAVDREGVMGTLFINEQTVSLLDLYSILGNKQKKTPQPVLVNKKFQTGKILLVDDSPMYRKLEGDVLREAGYDVQTANNGVQGWEMFQTGSYDLVITDIEMPGMDGYGLARKVREQSNVPILALSTKASSADVEKGREFGFSHHLEKFEKDQVLALVSQILGEVNEGSHATIS